MEKQRQEQLRFGVETHPTSPGCSAFRLKRGSNLGMTSRTSFPLCLRRYTATTSDLHLRELGLEI